MKYFKGIFRNTLIEIYKVSARMNVYILAAIILFILTKPLSKRGKYRILTLSKPIFNEDTKAIDKISNDLCFLIFPRLLLAEYSKKLSDQLEISDGMWTVIFDGTPEQKKIAVSIDKLFSYLIKFIRFDAIFAGNYVYSSQQELFKSAQKRGIPVIVLYKEGLAPPGSMTKRVSTKLYRDKRFYGDKLLVYNSLIKKALVTAGIPGITEEKTEIVGIPRIDKFIHGRYPITNKSNIVLFAFDPNQKAFRYIDDKSHLQNFIHRSIMFQARFVRFCVENPEYKLTIKTKGKSFANSLLPILQSEVGLENLPNNVEITPSTSSYDLITQSAYVAGFTSTTLLEALILDRPIICPYFHDIIPVDQTDFFAGYPEIINYVKNYNDTRDLLLGFKEFNKVDAFLKDTVLRPLLYELDGNSSKRVENEILNSIESSMNIGRHI